MCLSNHLFVVVNNILVASERERTTRGRERPKAGASLASQQAIKQADFLRSTSPFLLFDTTSPSSHHNDTPDHTVHTCSQPCQSNPQVIATVPVKLLSTRDLIDGAPLTIRADTRALVPPL
jgi:hypothetical protein